MLEELFSMVGHSLVVKAFQFTVSLGFGKGYTRDAKTHTVIPIIIFVVNRIILDVLFFLFGATAQPVFIRKTHRIIGWI